MSNEIDRPNTTSGAAPIQTTTMSLEQQITEQLTAMRNQRSVKVNEHGESGVATTTAEVAIPEGESNEVVNTDASTVEPEIAEPTTKLDAPTEESETPDTRVIDEDAVADDNSNELDDVIDFMELANENPNAKFKFIRNGKEMIIDAKKAAAILGQGGAIHEDARQLKIEKADFDEWKKEEQNKQAGLALMMEMTIMPEIQNSINEIQKVQDYNNIFTEQYYAATDEETKQDILNKIEKNNNYISNLSKKINETRLPLQGYYNQRKELVKKELDARRRSFTDKDLRNEYLFTELREKIAKGWEWAQQEVVYGVPNIDLISSDEHILSLIRDGLKYREKPKSQSAGNSLAALTTKKSSGASKVHSQQSNVKALEDAARRGDKSASENLVLMKLQALRSGKK